MKKFKLKNKYKNYLYKLLFLICVIVFVYSLYNIIFYFIDNKNTDKQIDNIFSETVITEVNEEDTEIIVQEEEIEESNPYWDYIKMNLIDVNLSDLKKENSDTKGWIYVGGTNINYPFVQTTDNQYYLTHSFDKSSNKAGWVFLDYRNNLEDSNEKNTIIYAHGRINGTMFGSLRNIFSNGWLDNEDNYIIKLSTENENTLWQVFSVYKIEETSDYIQTEFESDEEYQTFLEMLINRSEYNFNTSINNSDRILTLSTCYDSSRRVVLHAKLIKKEEK